MSIQSFLEHANLLADKFRKTNTPVKIVCHLDTDGLTSSAILIKALAREKMKFAHTIFKQLTIERLKELALEPYKTVIFADLGSNSLNEIEEILKDKEIYILDHHQLQKKEFKDNINILHPILHDLDGGKDVSSSGVSYLFTKALNQDNIENSYIGIIGAIGDIQEHKGFTGLNALILEDVKPYLEITTGLRFFGAHTRPLHKVLEYSTDPFIPGITGNESACVSFLETLEIPLLDENGKFRKLVNLTQDEMRKLSAGVIMKRVNESSPEDIFGPIYLLKNQQNESYFKDVREFSTILNSCGRLNKPSIGIGALLDDENSKQKAVEVMTQYKIELIKGLNWIQEQRKLNNLIENENFIIINAENNIRETIIGTVSSILSKSNIFPEGTIILSLAHTIEGNTKVSARICGYKQHNINLKEVISIICKDIKAELGGHEMAAGCSFSQDQDELFINNAKEYLSSLVITS